MSIRMWLYSAVTRAIIKPWVRRQKDPKKLRAAFERHARRTHVPIKGAVFRNGFLNEVPVKWVEAGYPDSAKILFYIHGGGFIVGSPETHKDMIAALCRKLQMSGVLPRYRLAPEHPFPAGFEDVKAAYLGLVASGRAPKNIVLGGDSAGGNLALALLAWLSAEGLEQPGCAFVLSPVVDFSAERDSVRSNAASETLLPAHRGDELAEMYLQGADKADPRASPLLAKFERCPPILFHVCDGEILRDDTYAMQKVLVDKGHDVTVRSWPNGFHVFHIMYGHFPEAEAAMKDIAAFVRFRRSPNDS